MGVFERQIKQEVILEAAAKVFCSRGFGSTKMIHVAKEARLSKGLLYFYYKSKEDLYMAVILHAIKKTIQFHKYESDQNAELTGLERLMVLMDKYFDFIDENPYYQDAISTFINLSNPLKSPDGISALSKGMQESPYYEQIIEMKFEPFKIITKIMVQGKMDGSIKTNLPPIYLFLSIWSLMIGYEKLSISDSNQLPMIEDNPFFVFDDKQWKSTIMSIAKTILTKP